MMSDVSPSTNGAMHRSGVPSRAAPFTDAEKAAAIARVKSGEATWAVALSLKAHDAQIRDWCKQGGVTPPPPVHDPAFIKAAVTRVKGGESLTSVILSLGIGRGTLQSWLVGKPTLQQQRTAALAHDPKDGTMKNVNKELKGLPKAKPGKRRIIDKAYKAQAVAQVTGGISAQQVAHRLDLSPSVVQRWVRLSKDPPLEKDEKALIKKTVAAVMNKPAGVTTLPSGRRLYSQEFRLAAVARVKAGERPAVVAKELGLGNSILYVWVRELGGKRTYTKHAILPGATGTMPMASALAVRDAITYLKHVKTDMYMLLQTGAIKEFEEYHLNMLAALKRLQSVA
jgi:transposase-like protein